MLRKNRAYKNNLFQPFILWFCHCLFLFIAVPLNAAPDPYHHNFKIYSITRPGDLKAFGESYEVDPDAEKARLSPLVDEASDSLTGEPQSLTRQESAGKGKSTGVPAVEGALNQVSGQINSVQIAEPVQETSSIGLDAIKKERPDEFFVEYDSGVIPVKDLADLGGGAFNVLCQNQKAWFRVDKDKAINYGVPESKILIVKGVDELVDMSPYSKMSTDWETEGLTEEAIQAYNREVCMTTTDVLRHVSSEFGHADLKVNSGGFLLTSWLKSLKASDPWHQFKRRKPAYMPSPVLLKAATPHGKKAHQQLLELYQHYEEKLARYEAFEQWYEDYRTSRSKESLMSMFWPDWFDNIMTEEHPQFLEKGTWNEGYQLTVKRHGVEMINLDAQIKPMGIWQTIVQTTYQGGKSQQERDTIGMSPAMMLPFYVLSGEVGTVRNESTYTPLARPGYGPVNRVLTKHVYHTHYRPELNRDYKISWSDIPAIPAVVYDFYSDDDDLQARPMNRQPRLTYWVGKGGDFDGRLLGRRILYKTAGKKPIGCDAGPPVCHYEYSSYRGLEYRLLVSIKKQPQQKQEGETVRQPDVTSSKEQVSDQSRTPPSSGASGGSRHEKLNSWYSYFTGGRKTSGVIQNIQGEAIEIIWAYLNSVLYENLLSAAFASAGVKYQSPVPKIPTLSKILLARMLQHMNLVH